MSDYLLLWALINDLTIDIILNQYAPIMKILTPSFSPPLETRKEHQRSKWEKAELIRNKQYLKILSSCLFTSFLIELRSLLKM